ncbi:hypothetical protein IV203_015674 [Nitzschia inconspicua]|uniref:Uncharacterized protein n=1 Tax=Nitzschia inconspicua TaxID=303405 RepID=A0A9K3LCB4_9STRA|nr:hypothetical protein IV203_015674 [Nitzschia inconspicua]
MLNASMYEENGSFATGGSSNNNVNSNKEQMIMMDSSTSFGRGTDDAGASDDVVDPPPYPPPDESSFLSSSFPPPPVRVIETSTADWGMMVVDESSNNNSNSDLAHDAADEDDDDYELVQGGVLILDGVSSTGGEENHGDDPDAASLSVPDSDNIPSDPGTIHGAGGVGGEPGGIARSNRNWEHLISDDEEDGDDDDEEEATASRGRRRRAQLTLKDIYPRVCHLVRSARDAITTAFDGTTNDDASSSEATTVVSSFPQFLRSAGIPLLVVAMAVLSVPGYSYYRMAVMARKHEARWIELQEENARLQLQEERLRQEMESLQEEAAMAMAKATSLHREHEKWKLLNSVNGGADKDFYFLDNDDCDKDSFTVLDNCWIKAKANVRLGDCGDDTKDFFKDLWNSFWKLPFSWGSELYGDYGYDDPSGYYTMEPYSSSACSPSSIEEECRQSEQESDEYDYRNAEEDPLGTVFAAVQSFGQSLSEKMSQLMRDEVATTRKAATELEDAIQKRFYQASTAISDAMAATKKDMQALSQEVLTTLNAAVPNNNSPKTDEQASSSKPQAVTRKGLFDAASALTSLSKTWNEAVASISTVASTNEDGKK